MPSFKYGFVQLPNQASRPFLPLVLENPFTSQWIRVIWLVDTGADACLLPEHIASLTGHNLKGNNVQSSISKGIDGKEVTTWKHTFKISLFQNFNYQTPIWTGQNTLIDCVDHNNVPALLGNRGFLRFFKVILDYPRQTVTVEF